MTSLPVRPLIGFGAAGAAVAFVAVAAATAPATETTLHASSGCPYAEEAAQPADIGSGAERPA